MKKYAYWSNRRGPSDLSESDMGLESPMQGTKSDDSHFDAKNAFGKYMPPVAAILNDPKVSAYVHSTLSQVLSALGADDPSANSAHVLERLRATDPSTLRATQLELHYYLAANGAGAEQLSHALASRSDLIYQQIKPYVKGPAVLDLGCGDGKVGMRFAQDGYSVALADVYRHPALDETLRFIPLEQGKPFVVPQQQKYDTILLLTVMHHSNTPLELLKDASQHLKEDGRIVVIESVYRLGKEDKEMHYGGSSDTICDAFKALRYEQQFEANGIFDMIYNNIFTHPSLKVNVPFNFRAADVKDYGDGLSFAKEESWQQQFEKAGLKVGFMQHLGIDQPIVPEYHTLYVLEKK